MSRLKTSAPHNWFNWQKRLNYFHQAIAINFKFSKRISWTVTSNVIKIIQFWENINSTFSNLIGNSNSLCLAISSISITSLIKLRCSLFSKATEKHLECQPGSCAKIWRHLFHKFIYFQDLKDLMRRAGEVTYANAHNEKRNEG